MSEEKLIELVNLAEESGDTDTAIKALEKLKELRSQNQGDSLYGKAIGAVEPLATIGTGIIAEPIAGLSGLAALPFTDKPVVQNVREALTYNPKTESGQKNIQALGNFLKPLGDAMEAIEQGSGDFGYDLGGPITGAIFSALPAAALEVLGLAAPKIGAKIASKASSSTLRKAKVLDDAVKKNDVDTVVKTISSADPKEVIPLVNPDPAFIKAADELNISVEPIASYMSKNPQYRSVEMALSAVPGSQIDSQGKAFVSEVSKKADELIQKYGGSTDKAALSERFRQESLRTVDNLFQQADDLYTSLDKVIPKETPIQANKTLDFINSQGGKLSPLMKSLVDDLSPQTKSVIGTEGIRKEIPTYEPSYSLLSQRRKEVGQALNKKTGPFKDAGEGVLKGLYRSLRQDQDNLAKQFGQLEISKAADSLVVQRKTLEDSLQNLLGKDISGSISVKAGSELKKLSKGELEKFRNFVNDVPENFRTEVIVSSLNDLFRGTGVDQQALNATKFSKVMDDLSRQPTLKNELYKHLSEGAQKDLDNLHKITKGISVAQQDRVKTGAINALFNDQQGMIRKLIGQGAGVVVPWVSGKVTGNPMAGNVIKDVLTSRTPRTAAASEMLGSGEFRSLLINSVRDGVIEGKKVSRKLAKAEKNFQKSETYKRWANTLNESDTAKLASVGLINYLFEEQEE